jgi:diadenosine tetraphosphate (Ap4A) HIT family hydrolase
MTPDESAELGAMPRRLVPAVKAATGAHRVYFLALMERVAHFHMWLAPKEKGGAAFRGGLPGAASCSGHEAGGGRDGEKDPKSSRSKLMAGQTGLSPSASSRPATHRNTSFRSVG